MANVDFSIESITKQLKETTIPSENGISFAGKGLKLDKAEDAKQIVAEIEACERLEFLNLEGNSLGVEAAKEIAGALSKKKEFKTAIWKDMFTGRLKTEIPKALDALGKGVISAGAKLEVLDLSDNASGPIGVEGFQELLKSPSCFHLKELRLNNMGLGVTGAQMLAKALLCSLEKSKEAGKPLSLKVFVAGRNRLEDEGSKALSIFFKEVGSLEELSLPQNGIYLLGMESISDALKNNKCLRVLNLNDNTIGNDGAEPISKAVEVSENLNNLDLGDCLLSSDGSKHFVPIFEKKNFKYLEEVNFSFNEIPFSIALKLIEGLSKQPVLKVIRFTGNGYKKEEFAQLEKIMADQSKPDVLVPFCDDDEEEEDEEESSDEAEDENNVLDEEGDEEEDEEGIEGEDDSDDEEEDDNEDDYERLVLGEEDLEDLQGRIITLESPQKLTGVSPLNRPLTLSQPRLTTAADFLNDPKPEKFLGVPGDKAEKIVQEIQAKPEEEQLSAMLKAIMHVSGLCAEDKADVGLTTEPGQQCAKEALKCSQELYNKLFNLARKKEAVSFINNTLPVYLGLIKNEDKSDMKKKFNNRACMFALQNAMNYGVVPKDTCTILNILKNL